MNDSGKRDYINHFANSEPKTGVLFTTFVTQTVLRKSKRMGTNYQHNYQTLLFHLDGFSKLYEADIFTNSVNEEFMDDFIVYLEGLNLRLTYINTLVNLIKSMIRKAGTYGYAVDTSYDDVELDNEDPFAVFLSMNEITRIYYFLGLTKKQERIRDLFIVGCMTALRYSDYSTLTRNNFSADYITKVTKKTGKKVIVPIHDYVREIFAKYDGEISAGLCIQHFNRYIKMICKKVGMNNLIIYNYTKGGILVTKTKQKWEMISSHTARRSAATNLYMTGRLKTYEIMSLTGHSTEKSFFKYIKTASEDTAKHIGADSFFRK